MARDPAPWPDSRPALKSRCTWLQFLTWKHAGGIRGAWQLWSLTHGHTDVGNVLPLSVAAGTCVALCGLQETRTACGFPGLTAWG